jgi:hypothetical protein
MAKRNPITKTAVKIGRAVGRAEGRARAAGKAARKSSKLLLRKIEALEGELKRTRERLKQALR